MADTVELASENTKPSSNTPSGTQQHNNPLSRKLKKILDTRIENDKDLLEALKALSTFFTENTLRTRRNLRGDVERRSVSISEQFEVQYRAVKEQLDNVVADVQQMDQCCQQMISRLKSSKESTADLINKTTKLQNERSQIEMQAEIASAFIKKFQLAPSEMKSLRGHKDSAITEEFFASLEHAKQIHQDCKLLLRSKQQQVGLEIMESMALFQETAYEKLYRWSQGECRLMTGDVPDITSAMCQALCALQDRPVLFKYTLDELSNARRTAVVRCFIDALTRGGSTGTPRPIELHSHDPVRYVGDMLAWLHQSVASEKELISSLLKKTASKDDQKLIHEVLNHITEGACRPLKVRLEQVVTSEPGPSVLFRLCNLLKFYGELISPVLGKESIMSATVQEMLLLCQRMFYSSLASYGSKLSEKIDLPPSDLGPPQFLLQTMTLLKDILSSQDATITPLEERQKDYDKIFSAILDPLLQSCALSASHLNAVDMSTYMINCLHQIQSTLAVYEFTDVKIEMLAGQIEAHSDTLISEQASFIYGRSGLGPVYSVILENKQKEVPLATLSGLDSQSVKSAMIKFDKYLSSPDNLIIPQVDLIISTRIRDTIHKRSIDIICMAYNTVHEEVMKESNKFDQPQALMLRTPDQVLTLLA